MDTTERGPGRPELVAGQRADPARRRGGPRGRRRGRGRRGHRSDRVLPDPNSPRLSTPTPNSSSSSSHRAAPRSFASVTPWLPSRGPPTITCRSIAMYWPRPIRPGDRALAGHWVRSGDERLLGPHRPARRDGCRRANGVRQRRPPRRNQVQPARSRTGEGVPAPIAARGQGFHRRRLRLHRSAARRRRIPQSRSARGARPDRSHRLDRVCRAGRRRHRRIPGRDESLDSAGGQDVRTARRSVQGRLRVHRVAVRASGSLPHGQRPGRDAVAATPHRSVRPHRRAGNVPRSRSWRLTGWVSCSRWTVLQ